MLCQHIKGFLQFFGFSCRHHASEKEVVCWLQPDAEVAFHDDIHFFDQATSMHFVSISKGCLHVWVCFCCHCDRDCRLVMTGCVSSLDPPPLLPCHPGNPFSLLMGNKMTCPLLNRQCQLACLPWPWPMDVARLCLLLWSSVRNASQTGDVCISSGNSPFSYHDN